MFASVILSGACTILAANHVFAAQLGAVVCYIAAIVLFYRATVSWPRANNEHTPRYVAALIITIPLAVRFAFLPPLHFHQDEFILAYHAMEVRFGSDPLFGGFPRNPADWPSQIPLPFLAFERFWMELTGIFPGCFKVANIFTIELISLVLFLLTRDLYGVRTASLAVLGYAFLPPSIYFEQFAINNHLGTVMLLGVIWLGTVDISRADSSVSGLVGLVTGFAYLFHQSSYLALPVLLALLVIKLFRFGRRPASASLAISLLGFSLVLAPFLIHRWLYPETTFFTRFGQVVAMTAPYFDLSTNIQNGIMALYRDGVGGGYHGFMFGMKRLFSLPCLLFLSVGILHGLFRRQSRSEFLVIFGLILVTYVVGMMLTAPQPPYQRLTSIYPILGIVVALAWDLFSKSGRVVDTILLVAACGVYIGSNILHIKEVQSADAALYQPQIEDYHLSKYIAEFHSSKSIRIVARQGFHLSKYLYFFNTALSPETAPLTEAELNGSLPKNTLYVFLLDKAGDRRLNIFRERHPLAIKQPGPWLRYEVRLVPES